MILGIFIALFGVNFYIHFNISYIKLNDVLVLCYSCLVSGNVHTE